MAEENDTRDAVDQLGKERQQKEEDTERQVRTETGPAATK